jgi:hypothetical protein
VQSQVSGSVVALDINGDGALSAAYSVIVSRYLSRCRGDAQLAGLSFAASALHTTAKLLVDFINSGCVADAMGVCQGRVRGDPAEIPDKPI